MAFVVKVLLAALPSSPPLGAETVNWQALADGAVDGQENPLIAIVGMRFHEVQKHLTLSNHAYLGYVFAASRKTFETLPPAQREIIEQAARELTLWERTETARREAQLLETVRAALGTGAPHA